MHETLSITALIPREAAAAEIAGSCAGCALLPAEEVALGHVSDRRRREFALGRACARQAMQKLGLRPQPIVRGPDREPLWPPGICGSITHYDGYGAAVVARKSDIRSIGIDAERIEALGDAVLHQIALDTERAWIKDADPKIPWAALLFSAKESVFKAWFQVFGAALSFEHARIDFHPTSSAFRATVSRSGAGAAEFIGRYRFDRQRVQTSAFIPGAQIPTAPCRGQDGGMMDTSPSSR